ncbi:MAG: hypothetical protein HFI65_02655 [Lachnospiraceae bacterium]|nr:hypothetical protein [Lachnospiraceae bacterium]
MEARPEKAVLLSRTIEQFDDSYSKRQKYLPFTIDPPGEAHDFCKVDSALMRSKNRRSRRHKEKIYVVCYNFEGGFWHPDPDI